MLLFIKTIWITLQAVTVTLIKDMQNILLVFKTLSQSEHKS